LGLTLDGSKQHRVMNSGLQSTYGLCENLLFLLIRTVIVTIITVLLQLLQETDNKQHQRQRDKMSDV